MSLLALSSSAQPMIAQKSAAHLILMQGLVISAAEHEPLESASACLCSSEACEDLARLLVELLSPDAEEKWFYDVDGLFDCCLVSLAAKEGVNYSQLG